MKNNVIIRADGGVSIGMGHVVRCLALADMLKNDFNIVFAIQQPDESIANTIHTVTDNIIQLPLENDYQKDISNFESYLKSNDIVVLDGYHFKTDYQKRIKNKGCKLVCIDDLHSWHQVADVIINHAEGVDESLYSAEGYTKFCLGLDYLLLRKPFLKLASTVKKISAIKKVFISMGAADVNNLTQKFTEALTGINGLEEIHLMLGSINPHLKSLERLIENNKQIKIKTHFNISAEELVELLKNCDLAICPASSISLECCAVGIGLISGYTAENQLGNLAGMEKRKTLINFGDMNLLTVEEIKVMLHEISRNPKLLNELIKNQKKMIDGTSPERILSEFIHLRTKTTLWT